MSLEIRTLFFSLLLSKITKKREFFSFFVSLLVYLSLFKILNYTKDKKLLDYDTLERRESSLDLFIFFIG